MLFFSYSKDNSSNYGAPFYKNSELNPECEPPSIAHHKNKWSAPTLKTKNINKYVVVQMHHTEAQDKDH